MSIYDPTPGQQVFGPCLPSYDELQGCIRCGRCLPVCPTYGETQLEMYSPRGRLSLLRAVEDGKLELTSGVEAHLYHCLDCRACNTVCPPGVRIGELIVRGRVAVEEQHPRPRWIKFMLQHVLTGAERAEVLSGPFRGTQFLKLDRLGAGALGWVPGIGAKLRQLVEFRAADATADPGGAAARHARGRPAPPSRGLLPGLHDERRHARREPGDGAGAGARRLRCGDPTRPGVLRRAAG